MAFGHLYQGFWNLFFFPAFLLRTLHGSSLLLHVMWSGKPHGASTISSPLLGTTSFLDRSRGIGISTVSSGVRKVHDRPAYVFTYSRFYQYARLCVNTQLYMITAIQRRHGKLQYLWQFLNLSCLVKLAHDWGILGSQRQKICAVLSDEASSMLLTQAHSTMVKHFT